MFCIQLVFVNTISTKDEYSCEDRSSYKKDTTRQVVVFGRTQLSLFEIPMNGQLHELLGCTLTKLIHSPASSCITHALSPVYFWKARHPQDIFSFPLCKLLLFCGCILNLSWFPEIYTLFSLSWQKGMGGMDDWNRDKPLTNFLVLLCDPQWLYSDAFFFTISDRDRNAVWFCGKD